MASNSTTISTTMSSAAESSTSAASSSAAASSSSVESAITSSIAESVSSAVSSSIAAPTTSTAAPTSNTEIVSTSTISESSIPPTTAVVTSVVTRTPTPGDTNTSAVVVTVTAVQSGTTVPVTTGITSTGRSSTTSSSPALNTGGSGSGGSGGGGLSTAGTTAVAVVVPVAVVALLVLGGIFFWRKRKAKKASEEQRRKEIEDYGFNPNNDPTLPGVGVASDGGTEMAEDNSGYRGWGAATGSNRKMSTTLSGGHTQGQLSDAGSNAYGSQLGAGSASPTGGNSDGHSSDPLMHQRRETMNSDIGSLGAIGGAPVAGTAAAGVGVKRGPSNASSTYSAGNHSDVSDGPPPGGMGMSQSYEAYNPNGFGYSQHGPYGDGTYGGAQQDGNGMPIVRDVSARRNTRIQQPGNYQQGNSGIAQNF